MEKVNNPGMMVIFMMENLSKEKDMDFLFVFFQMAINVKPNISKEKYMEKENTIGRMAENMTVIGIII